MAIEYLRRAALGGLAAITLAVVPAYAANKTESGTVVEQIAQEAAEHNAPHAEGNYLLTDPPSGGNSGSSSSGGSGGSGNSGNGTGNASGNNVNVGSGNTVNVNVGGCGLIKSK